MTQDYWPVLSQALAARQDMMIQLLQALVQRPSVGNEAEVQAYIAQWWRSKGLEPDVWEPNIDELRQHRGFVEVDYDYTGRPNIVALRRGRGGGRSLTLNSHVDVVPVDTGAAWTHGGPWSGALVDGRVYGRGALDMKSGVALGLMLMETLMACDIPLLGDIQLQCVVDEETGGNGTLAAIQRGYRSDATIFLEPTGPDQLIVTSRGAQFFRIVVPAVEGGIEYQFTLPNAIDKAMLIFRAVEAYALWRAAGARHPLYAHDPTKIPASICTIHAGNWPSTLPAQCVMEGSLECLPGEDIDQVKENFRDYVLEAARRDPWLVDHPPRVEWFGLRLEAGATAADDPLVTGLQAACRATLGQAPVVVGGGGSDLRLPVLYAGSPSVLYGAKGGAIHSTDEYVEVESMMQAAQAIGRFILDWCSTAK